MHPVQFFSFSAIPKSALVYRQKSIILLLVQIKSSVYKNRQENIRIHTIQYIRDRFGASAFWAFVRARSSPF